MAIKTNGFKMPNGDVHTFIPPSPTENERGGIKAKPKTTESLEVAFDETTERLYAATPGTDKTLSESDVAADAKTTGDKIKTKLDKNQGKENVGKALVIGGDGNVVPGEVQSGDDLLIVNTASGESPLAISDSSGRMIKGFRMTGKTEQVQTTGKKLLDDELLKTLSNYTSNGKDYYYYRFSGLEIGKQYTLSRSNIKSGSGALFGISVNQESYNSAKFLVYDGLGSSYNNASITWSQTTGEYIDILFSINANIAQSTQEKLTEFWERLSYVQLEEGSTATANEPYTGGKPAPSPEYPQDIVNAGKLNEDTGKYEVEISISGRNLFDFSACEEGKVFEASGNIISAANGLLTDFIPCFPNSQYSRTPTGFTVVAFYDCDKNKIGFEIVGNATFVTPEKCRYFRYSINKVQVDYKKLVACPGDTAMDYEPYYHKPIFLNLTSDRPITKWDKLVEQDGQIGWLYGSAINEYRGDTIVAIYANGFYFLLNNKKLKSGEGYCEELKQYVAREGNPSIAFNMSPNTYAYTLNTQAIYGSTVSAIKEYLKTHPLHLVYKTETTEFIPLPQSEQNAIRAMTTYYPSTTLINDQGCTMELDYVADPKNFILGQIGNLQKSLVNTQVQLL